MFLLGLINSLIKGVVALVVLGIIFLLTAPMFISGEQVAARIEKTIKQKTGKEVKFSGEFSFKLIMRPSINSESIFIKSESGEEPVRLDNVYLQVDLLSILSDGGSLDGSFKSGNAEYKFSADKSGEKYEFLLESPAQIKASALVQKKAGSEIKISDLKYEISKTSGSGAASIRTDPSTKAITGELKFEKLDVADLMNVLDVIKTPFADNSTAAVAAEQTQQNLAAAAGWSAKPIKLDALRNIVADFAVSADTISFGATEAGKAEAKISVERGLLKLEDLNAHIFQGTVRIASAINDVGDKIIVEHSIDAEGVDLDEFMKSALKQNKLAGKLFGKADVDLKLQTSGRNQADLISALAGSGSIEIRDGGLRGLDMQAVSRANDIASLLGSEGTVTDIKSMVATLNINNGEVLNEDLDVQTSVGKITGHGKINLLLKEMNYSLLATVKPEGAEHNLVKIPVTIAGRFDALKVSPDVQSFAVDGINKILNNESMMNKIDDQLNRKLNMPEGTAQKLLENLNNSLQGRGQGGVGNILQQFIPQQNAPSVPEQPKQQPAPEGYYMPVPQNAAPADPTAYGGGMMVPVPQEGQAIAPADSAIVPDGYYSKQQEQDKAMEEARKAAMEKIQHIQKQLPAPAPEPGAVAPVQPSVNVPAGAETRVEE